MPKCKGCGATIVWVTLENGRAVPLDPRPPVYDVSLVSVAPEEYGAVRADRRRFMVSHFATCPNADDFSSSRKKQPGREAAASRSRSAIDEGER